MIRPALLLALLAAHSFSPSPASSSCWAAASASPLPAPAPRLLRGAPTDSSSPAAAPKEDVEGARRRALTQGPMCGAPGIGAVPCDGCTASDFTCCNDQSVCFGDSETQCGSLGFMITNPSQPNCTWSWSCC